jgi:hypothetical protein
MRFCCRARVVDRVQRDLTFLAATVFAAADQLWTNSALRPDRYAQPVLALIALRQMEAKFEAVHAELAPNYKGRLKPTPSDYQAAYHLRRPRPFCWKEIWPAGLPPLHCCKSSVDRAKSGTGMSIRS